MQSLILSQNINGVWVISAHLEDGYDVVALATLSSPKMPKGSPGHAALGRGAVKLFVSFILDFDMGPAYHIETDDPHLTKDLKAHVARLLNEADYIPSTR